MVFYQCENRKASRLKKRLSLVSSEINMARILPIRLLASRQSCLTTKAIRCLLASHPKCDQVGSTTSKWFSSTNNFPDAKVASLQDRLFMGALKHVPEHGWTEDAITAAASELQPPMSLATAGLLTVNVLVSKAMEFWNRALQDELEQRWGATPSNELLHDNDIIIQAFQWRLERVQDLIRSNRWHEGMAVGAQPGQVAYTKNQIAEIVDITVSHCSSTLSAAERIGLGAVYVAVEFHMLSDKSEGFSDTWMFLHELVLDWDRLRKNSMLTSLPFASSDAYWTATHVGSAIFSGVYTIFSRPTVTVGTNPRDYESVRTS